MRTTLDLPDALLRQLKAQAALDGTTLKSLIAELVERGLAQRSAKPTATTVNTGRLTSMMPVNFSEVTAIKAIPPTSIVVWRTKS